MSDQITPIEAEIIKELLKKDTALAAFFEFALRTFRASKDPARLPFVAHGIRTTLNELTKYVNTPVPTPPRLGDLFSALNVKWVKLITKTAWPGNPKWNGQIDNHLTAFLAFCEDFFEKAAAIHLKRAERAASVIRSHNFGTAPIPSKIESHKAQEWLMYLDFFNGVTHLSGTTEEEFLGYLETLELSLINILLPKTFDNQARILESIREAERNAQ